jgi:hypothetical protein
MCVNDAAARAAANADNRASLALVEWLCLLTADRNIRRSRTIQTIG